MNGFTRYLSALGGFGLIALSAMPAAAAYPDHPIHIVVGFAPGGGTDLAARVIAPQLSEKFGQPVIVDNKAGAAGTIAADYVAHSNPDGYTLNLIVSSHAITPSLMDLNYDPVKSFAPIRQLVFTPDVLVVGNASPAKTLKDLLDVAKSDPGKVTFGDAGNGVPSYLEMMMLGKATGTVFTHVAYKSGNEAALAIMSGEIQSGFASLGSVLGQIQNGQLRALASSTTERAPMLPDVPTIAEAISVKSFDAANADWLGLIAPAGTPKDIVDKLNSAITEIENSPDVKAKFLEMGFITIPQSSPDEFGKIIADDITRWTPMLKDQPHN